MEEFFALVLYQVCETRPVIKMAHLEHQQEIGNGIKSKRDDNNIERRNPTLDRSFTAEHHHSVDWIAARGMNQPKSFRVIENGPRCRSGTV